MVSLCCLSCSPPSGSREELWSACIALSAFGILLPWVEAQNVYIVCITPAKGLLFLLASVLVLTLQVPQMSFCVLQ